ncbi:transposase family protein [Vibrio cholerae]
MSNQPAFMHFNVIPDYRQQGKFEHKLTDIILLTICAVLSGQDDWKAIHLHDTRWLDFLKCFCDFSHGVLSAITITRVMGMINVTRLQKCFIEWVKSC